MTLVVAGFGVLMILAGVVGVLVPSAMIRFSEYAVRSSIGFFAAIAGRVVLGVIFLLAASDTRFPWVIGGLGALVLVAAVGLAVMGRSRIGEMAHQWAKRPAWILRGAYLLAIGFGAFLAYAAS